MCGSAVRHFNERRERVQMMIRALSVEQGLGVNAIALLQTAHSRRVLPREQLGSCGLVERQAAEDAHGHLFMGDLSRDGSSRRRSELQAERGKSLREAMQRRRACLGLGTSPGGDRRAATASRCVKVSARSARASADVQAGVVLGLVVCDDLLETRVVLVGHLIHELPGVVAEGIFQQGTLPKSSAF